MELSTCENIRIALYPHLVPVVLAMFLAIYALVQTRFSRLSVIFLLFCTAFSIWLVGDLILWTASPNELIYFAWSWLDLINVVFFVLGAYFFAALVNDKVSVKEYFFLGALCVPVFIATTFGLSVTEFNHSVCEVFNNNLVSQYKLLAEGLAVLYMLSIFARKWSKFTGHQRSQYSLVLLAILLFFGVFSSTEFFASVTGVYEVNLYSLFVLPLFLILLTFAITDLRLFQLRFVGTQLLSYVLIIMIGSQLLFIEDSVSRTMSLVTLAISLFFGLLLVENAKKEAEARIEIEKLAGELENANNQLKDVNEKLKEIDIKKDEFLSIASHQLRTPIATIKGYAANLLDESYGKLHDSLKKPLEIIRDTSQLMSMYIEDYLNISRIEQGRMKYEFNTFDLHALMKEVQQEFKPSAAKRRLSLTLKAGKKFEIYADMGKVKQIIGNIVDNAIKYTEQGSIKMSLSKSGDTAVITVEDTGMGIASEEIGLLFTKFKRSRDAHNVSMSGTGLGLYVVKQLVEGHKGTVSVSSTGPGHGSTFTITLPIQTPPAVEGK